MIIGAVAAAYVPGQQGTQPFLDTVLYLDFMNGIYALDGAAVSVEDLVDPITAIDANGLRLDWNELVQIPPKITELGLASINAYTEWTVMVEFLSIEEGDCYPLTMQTDADESYGSLTCYLNIISRTTDFEVFMDFGDITFGLYPNVTPTWDQVRKIAVRYSASQGNAASATGEAVDFDTQTSATIPQWEHIALGGVDGETFSYINGYIRRVVIYPTAKSDAELEVLSAL